MIHSSIHQHINWVLTILGTILKAEDLPERKQLVCGTEPVTAQSLELTLWKGKELMKEPGANLFP